MRGVQTSNDEAILQLPLSLRELMTWERFHLHNPGRFQKASNDPSFDGRYFPQNCGSFRLPCYWIARKHFYVYGEQNVGSSEMSVFDGVGYEGKVLFPIHPSALRQYERFLRDVQARDAAEDGLCVWAVPTSSTRTVLAWPDQLPEQALFLKTSLHSPILGDRRLNQTRVGSSIGFCKVVTESLSAFPEAFGFFSEPVGLSPRRIQEGGAIIRSIPQDIKEGRVVVAPLFSLFGGTGHHTPLLLPLLQRCNKEPLDFVEDIFCAVVSKAWLQMCFQCGVMLEAHAQDLMLEFSPDLIPTRRFYYRDFEGLQVDWELRHHLGLPEPANLPRAWSWYETYATRGTRYTDFVWYKWMVSLLVYFIFVLNELEASLREWHESNLWLGRKPGADELTMMFSRHMLVAIEAMFGVRVGAVYNIYRHQRKFALLLMQLRRDLLKK